MKVFEKVEFALASIVAYVAAVLTVNRRMATVAVSRRARGLTFIEYGIMAILVIGVAFLFRNQLNDFISGLFGRANECAGQVGQDTSSCTSS